MTSRIPQQAIRVCIAGPADLVPDSGSTIYCRMLASSLAAAGCDVSVVCAKPHASMSVPAIVAPIPLRHPFDHFQGTPDAVFADAISVTVDAIERQWRPRRGDVIHAIYAGYNAIAAGVVAALSGTRTVVTELGRMVNVAVPGEERYRRMAALALHVADHTIAATHDIANNIQRQFQVPLSKQTVLAVPMDLAGFAPTRQASTRSPLTITTICSVLTEDKGVTDLVHAFAQARKRTPAGLRLNIVGQDYKAGEPLRHSLEHLIRNLAIAEDVTLTGYLPHGEIPEVLASTGIYVDARRSANFSSVILEAMAMQVPVVASAVESNVALLRDGIDAMLFAPGDCAALADALVRLATSPELANQLSGRGAAWIAEHSELFSLESHAARIVQIYRGFR
ncbi:MAG TPA: glycosyltransferase family 4 protein [Bryobacteraceae bacterium]